MVRIEKTSPFSKNDRDEERKYPATVLKKINNPAFLRKCPLKLVKAIEFVQENYWNKYLSTKIIAKKIGVSESYLCRLFHWTFGECCMDFLYLVRTEKAKSLLQERDLLIKQIASKVGFQSSTYFSRVFQKVERISPREYRRRSLQELTKE